MKDLTLTQTAKKLKKFIEEKNVSIFIDSRIIMFSFAFKTESCDIRKKISFVKSDICLQTLEYPTLREALEEALILIKEF